MTTTEIKKRVKAINDRVDSAHLELAHIEEDKLLNDFIDFVANFSPNLSDMAREIQEIRDYEKKY